ncbi:unnamed protein product [Sphenostylis stenocarpa]|uniref:Uncharacterized protein n=1 Tax=Sphenostylis stenocarpa TaxID=92480 RepID=A0AA86RRL6_9FABA|nr:unnamed protein product [Sphenostylis stenocarpa]
MHLRLLDSGGWFDAHALKGLLNKVVPRENCETQKNNTFRKKRIWKRIEKLIAREGRVPE